MALRTQLGRIFLSLWMFAGIPAHIVLEHACAGHDHAETVCCDSERNDHEAHWRSIATCCDDSHHCHVHSMDDHRVVSSTRDLAGVTLSVLPSAASTPVVGTAPLRPLDTSHSPSPPVRISCTGLRAPPVA